MGEQNTHRDFAQEVTNCLACYRTLNENVNKDKEAWRFADIAEKITIDSFTLSSWQLHGTNSHFFLVGKDEQAKTAYLAFKGSETMQDIFTDLTVFSSMVQPQGITHAGIQKRADSIPVDPFIDLLFEEYKLIITGFSLGGGVAQLFTARLINHPQCRSKEWVNKLTCITFGAPLVGDKEFGKLFNGEQSLWKELYHCFVNKDDIVVRLCSMADQQWQAITDIIRTLCGVSFMHSNVAASIIKSLALDLFEKLVPRYYPFGTYYHVKDSKVERFDQHGLDDYFAIPTTGVDVRLEHIRNHLSYYEHFKVLLIQQEYGSLNKIQPKVFQMVEIDGENCTALSEKENGVSIHLYGKNLAFVHTIIVNGYGIVDFNTSHGTKNNNHIGVSNLQIRPQSTQITVILETHFGAIELILRTITRTPLKDDTQRYDDLLLVEVLLATITRGLFEQPSSKMVQLTKYMEELLKKGSADDDIILSRYAAEMLLTEKLEDFNLENFTDNPKASLNAIIKELGGSNYTRDLREKISQALKAPHPVKITDPAKELPAFCYLEDIIALCQEKGKLDNHATSIFPLFYFLAIRLLRLLIQYNRKPTFFETIKKLLHKVSLVGFFRTLDLTIKIECCYQTRLTTLAQSLAIHIPNDIDGTALCSKLERNIYQHLGKHDIEYYMLNWRTIFKEPYSKVEEDEVKENIIAFIQCLQAIHEMRQELRNSFYVPIIGRKKAGKTTFIKYGFGFQGAEEGFDTIRPTMYETDDTIPLRIVDFPGHEESGLIYKALNRLPLPTANTIVVFVEFESALAEQTLQILTDVEKYGASNYLICLNRFDQFCSNLKVSRTADQQPKEQFSIKKYLQQKNSAQSHTSSVESSPSNGTVVDLVIKEAVERIRQYRKEIDLHLQAKADGGKAEIWVTSTSPDTKEVLFWQNALQQNGDGEQLRTSNDILYWITDAYSKKTQN